MEPHDLLTSGELFEAVQEAELFPDDKTFVDAVPREDPAAIREAFDDCDDLERFVMKHFDLPDTPGTALEADTLEDYIERSWELLERRGTEDSGTYIGLEEPYIVPGGRFRELYYWDSFFIGLGLAASNRSGLLVGMVQDLAGLVERFGSVPNGNRRYYLSRSQPPFFGEMLRLLAEDGFDQAVSFLPQLEQEYRFWMGSDHGVEAEGTTLNRYWDAETAPRPESYTEDVEVVRGADRGDDLFRDIRAACESGWDFSTRWTEGADRATIRTTEILPVDLNALLYRVECQLRDWYRRIGREEKADRYGERAEERAAVFDEVFWSDEAGYYFDHDQETGDRTDSWTLAGVFPLYAGLASEEQAERVAATLRDRFLEDGGLVTTLDHGFQWDSPNGWPPLHYVAVTGLRRYGKDELASEITSRWLSTCRSVFKRRGVMLEKYNVADPSADVAAGEYSNQVGFGWTNGVYLALQQDCPLPPGVS